jgi:hypothetical protein
MKQRTAAAWIDFASFATIFLTLVLFVIALFEKGLSQELSLEAGVFLVSIKLVLSTYKANCHARTLEKKVDLLLERVERSEPQRKAS